MKRPFSSTRLRNRPATVLGVLCTAVAVAAGAWVISDTPAGGHRSPGDHRIEITAAGCPRSWQPPVSGTTTFDVTNHSEQVVDVGLLGSNQATVFAELPALGPGVERPITVSLEPGTYSWRCLTTANALSYSAQGLVTGRPVPDPSPGFTPVLPDDLIAAAERYRAMVAPGLQALAAATDQLQAAIDGGRLLAARQLWLVAHLDYARLGAAYGTFGDYAEEIDGRADGLPGGVQSPKFTGFLRVEYVLWHDQPQAAATAAADQLDRDVHALVAAFPHQETPDTDLPLRAHEILENALQFELTGDTDEGSHTNLATVWANVQGTESVVAALAPLLTSRNPNLLGQADQGLAALAAQLLGYEHPAGSWVPLQSLTTRQRESLDGAVGGLLEVLDQFPTSLEAFDPGAD